MNQNNSRSYHFAKILSDFCIESEILIKTYGFCRINEAVCVENSKKDGADCLLQPINHHIFKDVPALIENIGQVAAHLRKKLEDILGSQIDKKVLTLVPTKDQQFYYQDHDGNYWRMYHFLDTLQIILMEMYTNYIFLKNWKPQMIYLKKSCKI